MLALAWQVPPSAVDKVSAADVAEMRWLYNVCPFGPLRGDMQAWMAGIQASRKGWTLEQAMGVFHFPDKRGVQRRRKRREPKRQTVTAEQMKAWAVSMGAIVTEPAKETEQPK